MFMKMFRRFDYVTLFFVLSVACSSENGSQSPSPSSILKPVSLQLQWVTQAQFAGYYVALEKGWYRDEGIELTIKPGGPDLVPVDLVASGTSLFGTTLLADLAVAIQNGKPVVSIGQIQQANGLLLIAKKDSGIRTPKDFIGKKVGIWLGSWEVQFNALLAKEGVAQKDIKIASQGWSMEPFMRGELDVASAMIYNEYHIVLERGVNSNDLTIIDYGDYDLGFPGDALFTSLDQHRNDPDLCMRMLRASIKGWQYAIEHPQESAEIVIKYDKTGVQTLDHQLSMINEISRLVHVPGRRIGHTDEKTVQRMIDILVHHNIMHSAIPPRQVFAGELFDRIDGKYPK